MLLDRIVNPPHDGWFWLAWAEIGENAEHLAERDANESHDS